MFSGTFAILNDPMLSAPQGLLACGTWYVKALEPTWPYFQVTVGVVVVSSVRLPVVIHELTACI